MRSEHSQSPGTARMAKGKFLVGRKTVNAGNSAERCAFSFLRRELGWITLEAPTVIQTWFSSAPWPPPVHVLHVYERNGGEPRHPVTQLAGLP